MKPFTGTEKNMSIMGSNKNDKTNRERIEQMASAYNHQERVAHVEKTVAHVEKTVAQFNSLFARLNDSKNGEK
ncbi:hypothetical protein [Bacillus subtilis]|uniref:Uncharacterized protein n=1 Tax=Bacillus subtilis TaxID=1423 RepID=A0AAP1E3A9_BACIU|nr:hypothetical protein [Bacillus subtilis]KIN51164.1 hypothetical protein B4146_0624 [Bacillus subtilis]KZD87349.1 hypothetical protein B4122_4573 [Bacillus subtilis]